MKIFVLISFCTDTQYKGSTNIKECMLLLGLLMHFTNLEPLKKKIKVKVLSFFSRSIAYLNKTFTRIIMSREY